MPRNFSEIPVQRISPRALKIRSNIILGALLLSSLLGILAFLRHSYIIQVPSAASVPDNYQAFAKTAAYDYLNDIPFNLPLAQGVSANLQNPNQQPTAPTVTIPYQTLTYKSDYFNSYNNQHFVIDGFFVQESNQIQIIWITILITPSGPVLGAEPNITNNTTPPSVPNQFAYQNPGTNLPQTIYNQINLWVSAYATNNQTELYSLTGDTQQRSYTGIGGYQSVGNPTINSYTIMNNNIVVNITFTMQSLSNSKSVLTEGFDLLITNITTQLPNIAAWGPPGVGNALKPFVNAIDAPTPTATTTTIAVSTTSTTSG